MKLFRVLFTTEKGLEVDNVVRAKNIEHAKEKISDKFHTPNGYQLHEGFEGNCKHGKLLYSC